MDQINNSKKSKDPSDLISYKQARARTRCLLRSSKKQSWEEFVSSINAPVSTSTMWRQIRKLSGQPNNFTFQPLSDQNKLFQTPSEISELLATNYSRISADSNFDSDFLPIKRDAENQPINFSTNYTSPGPLNYNLPITESEVFYTCLLYTSPSPRDRTRSRMPSSA